jgi:hypothetical protein
MRSSAAVRRVVGNSPTKLPRNWGIVAILWIVTIPVFAAEPQPGDKEKPEWAEEGRNEISIFLGVTESQDFERGFSVGIDYERRLSRLFGIGAVVEYTGSDLREGVGGITLSFHPWKELKIVAAPGVVLETADGTEEALLRIGAEYGFGIGKGWEIAPAVYYDFTSGDNALVIGAGFAKRF